MSTPSVHTQTCDDRLHHVGGRPCRSPCRRIIGVAFSSKSRGFGEDKAGRGFLRTATDTVAFPPHSLIQRTDARRGQLSA